MRIRPVTLDDHAAVLTLAKTAGIGMTSLPADADVLQDKIEAAVESFAANPAQRGKERFLFVLEDPASGKVVGTTGIKAHVGLNQPFYSYKLSTITAQSRELDIFSKRSMLNVNNDLTDCSEIGSLFLLPEYRRDRLGRLLSLSRFLFMAAFTDLFAEHTIAEMRGVHHRDGSAPFYDSIAKHFFEMDFAKADYLNATQGNQFINDLMPKYPIYTHLLPQSAQDVIGQPHPNSEPARAMLEREGFKWQGYVDIFDGGPTLQADTARLRCVEHSRTAIINDIRDDIGPEKYMLSNDRFEHFRSTASRLEISDDGTVRITERGAAMLNMGVGDRVRFASHKSGE
jgi:arginine N-succinyltransferase